MQGGGQPSAAPEGLLRRASDYHSGDDDGDDGGDDDYDDDYDG